MAAGSFHLTVFPAGRVVEPISTRPSRCISLAPAAPLKTARSFNCGSVVQIMVRPGGAVETDGPPGL